MNSRIPTQRFQTLLHRSLLLAGMAQSLSTPLQSLVAAETAESYFRASLGLASAKVRGVIPPNLAAAESLRWRTPLDPGHSTPVIAGGRIFLTTYRASTGELATVALDAETGAELWRRAVRPPKIEEFHPKTGNAVQASPACDGERVFAHFGSYGLLCYDLDGRLLWEQRMGPFQDEYGAGSSPILYDDKVILQQDHDLDSFLMALDRKTGKVIWKTPRPDAVRSYSTPALWRQNGRHVLLVAGSLELAAYDPNTGEKLWWISGLARIVIPTPVPVGDTIYMASWAPGGDASRRVGLDPWAIAVEKWDDNTDANLSRAEVKSPEVLDRFFRMDLNQDGVLNQSEWVRHAEVFLKAQNSVLAIRPSRERGPLPETDVVWKHSKGVPYVASPVVSQGRYWMVKDGGIVTQLDAATGRPRFEERLAAQGNYYASPVFADQKALFASENGVVSVLEDGPALNVLGSIALGEKIYATPVVDARGLYVRTENALYRFREPERR